VRLSRCQLPELGWLNWNLFQEFEVAAAHFKLRANQIPQIPGPAALRLPSELLLF